MIDREIAAAIEVAMGRVGFWKGRERLRNKGSRGVGKEKTRVYIAVISCGRVQVSVETLYIGWSDFFLYNKYILK